MAQKNPGWKQRFRVNPSAAGGLDPESASAKIVEANNRALEDFSNGLITADDAMAEFAAALRKFGRDAGMTVDERQTMADAAEHGLDAIASRTKQPGVTKESPVDLGKYLSDEQKELDEKKKSYLEMQKQVADALEKFRKGIIDAEEASKRASKAIDTLGEKAGHTKERREEDKMYVQEKLGLPTAKAVDSQSNRFNRAFGKLGLPRELGSKLGGMLGDFDPKGGLLGNLIGKNGLVSAIGGGAGGGLASFAGPLAIAQAASKVMAGVYDTASKGVKTLGDTASKVAKNDGLGALTGVGDAIGDMAAKVPIVGEALQAQIKMYTQFLKTFEQVTDAFAQRGKELKGYSGPIAQADAEGRVMKVMADLREAQNLGNDYAQVIREQAVMQTEMQRALEPIKHEIMRNLIPLMKAANVNIKAIGTLITFYAEAKQNVDKGVAEMILKSFPGLNDVMKVVGQAADKFLGQDKNKDPLKYLMDFANADIQVNNAWMGNPDPPQPLGIDLMK